MNRNKIEKDQYSLVSQKKFSMKDTVKKACIILVALSVIYWCYVSTSFSLAKLKDGWGGIVDIMNRMMPPSLDIIPGIIAPTIETIQISICGTLLAILFSIPLAICAASNITPHRILYTISRFILNASRAIPDMIFALIFVAAVGLGPFPGTLAIGFSSCGMLGKFIAESIENIDAGVLEAMDATGANRVQSFIYGIIPQVMPEFISLALFRWEMNFRASTVLGLVGAGGIGFELQAAMRLFNYRDMTMILIVILIIVSVVDKISASIRKRIV